VTSSIFLPSFLNVFSSIVLSWRVCFFGAFDVCLSAMMRVIDSSLLLMLLRVREYSSAYRLVFPISDDDMYHANSD
jgi:hypothetical protein